MARLSDPYIIPKIAENLVITKKNRTRNLVEMASDHLTKAKKMVTRHKKSSSNG